MEKLENKERTLLTKTLGPEKINDVTCEERKDEDLYKRVEKISDTVRED